MGIKERLRATADGKPGLVIDEGCQGLIGNLQALRHSEKNPSDCDVNPHRITHICDALRYACMLRGSVGQEVEAADEDEMGYIYYGLT